MTKQEILEKLKKSWTHCKKLDRDKKHKKKYPGHSYQYGWIMETVIEILKDEGVWNDETKT